MKSLEENDMKKYDKYKRLFLISISLLLSAILYNLLLLPLSLVTGGAAGIATITYYLYNINPALMIFLISAACSLISYMYLGKEKTAGSLIACIIYPFLVEITSCLTKFIKIDTNDILLLVLFAGVLSGIANGLMYKSGYTRGGLPVISQVLFEKQKISIAKSSMIINMIVVLFGTFFFGTTKALYAIIFLYINSIVMDKVLLGISNNKAFYIVTQKEEEVKKYIIDNLNHTITILDVTGGFLDKKKKVILTVIPSREYYYVTEGIKKIDKNAFFVVTDAYQVEGAK